MPTNLRGEELDSRLDAVLTEMLADGFLIAPISRAAVQKRLQLKSRSTLVGKRANQINEARDRQQFAAGMTSKRTGRATAQERVLLLQKEVAELRSVRDSYIENLMEIVQFLQRKGITVEDHLMPLRAQRGEGCS